MKLKRAPRKRIKLSEAAEMLGYKSSETVRQMVLNGTFKGIRMKDLPTSPIFIFRAEVERYLKEREIAA